MTTNITSQNDKWAIGGLIKIYFTSDGVCPTHAKIVSLIYLQTKSPSDDVMYYPHILATPGVLKALPIKDVSVFFIF